MKLTPQDITNQQFSLKFNGVSPDEVRTFLSQIAESIENDNQEKEELKQRCEKLRENLQKLERREEVLRDTLIAAQKFSSEIKSNAHKEAELITKEAEVRAEEIMNIAVSRQRVIRDETKNLIFKRREIESDIINMLNSLKELIETYHKEDEAFDRIEYINK